jgi:hypothetical protein
MVGSLLCLFIAIAVVSADTTRYAYVWVGNPTADFLATIDYNPASATYGTTLNRAYVDNTNSNVLLGGNEAHHMSMSADKNWIIVGNRAPGTKGKDEVFVYSVDPVTRFPQWAFSLDPPGGSCADEIVAVNPEKTQFVVTHLCNRTGGNPGALSWFDIITRETRVWSNSAETGLEFNPHGGDWNPAVGFYAASFVNPVVTSPRLYRDTIHVFNTDSTLNQTVVMPTAGITYLPGNIGAGYMDVKFIDDDGRAITCASLKGVLYLLQPFHNPPVVEALDIASLVNGGVNTFSGTTIRVNNAKNRLIATYGLRYVLLIGWNKRRHNFFLVDYIDMCDPALGFNCASSAPFPYAGAHYVRLNKDETQFILTSHYQGFNSIKRVHSFDIVGDWDGLSYESTFNPDVTPGNPHGVVIAEWESVSK